MSNIYKVGEEYKAKILYRLKKLKSIHMVFGNGIHRIDNCIPNLFESKTYKDIKNAKFIKANKTNKIESFVSLGMKIYAIPDLVYKNSKVIIIVDWKTGKEEKEKDRKQMEAYVHYLFNKYKNLNNIKTRLEYRNILTMVLTKKICIVKVKYRQELYNKVFQLAQSPG